MSLPSIDPADNNASARNLGAPEVGDRLMLVAMPALTMPLKDSLPKLRELAIRGDSRAQCRLASELQKCTRARRQLAFSESYIRRAEARKSGADVKGAMMVFGRSSLEEELSHCDGAESGNAAEIVKFWRQSAHSGNPEAMFRYATGAAFDFASIVHLADELQTYKKDAIAIARKSASIGDGRALIALASAYDPESHSGAPPLLAQVAGEDLVESLALFMLADRSGIRPSTNAEGLEKFIRGRIETLQLAASTEQLRQAELQASKLTLEWRTPVLPSGNERASLANAQVRAPTPEACEQ